MTEVRKEFSLLSQSYQKMCSSVEAKKGDIRKAQEDWKEKVLCQLKIYLYQKLHVNAAYIA